MTSRIGAEIGWTRPGPDDGVRPVHEVDRWFGVLWPLAMLFHLAGNPGHLVPLGGIGVLQLGLTLLAIGAIVTPRSWLMAALAGWYLLVFWLKLPVVGNHEVFLALLALAVVIGVVVARVRGRWWVEVTAPAVRLVLLIGYTCIAVSKLNRGFFDPAVSCAVTFGQEVFGPLWPQFGVDPGVSGGGVLPWAVIGVTAGVELAIPALLVVPATRRLGVAVAVTFHFVLALAPGSHVWDFSATLLPMFCLFASAEFRGDLDRWVDRLRSRPANEVGLAILLGCAIQGLAFVAELVPVWLPAYPLWLLYGGAVVVLAWRVLAPLRRMAPAASARGEARSVLAFRPAGPLLVVVGLAALNGFGPYLEYRSAAAFNMYANLEIVDGSSNHLLLGGTTGSGEAPSMLRIVSAVPDSDLRYYQDNQLLVPQENLARYLRQHEAENPLVAAGGGVPVLARTLGLAPSVNDDWGIGAELGNTLRYKLAFRRAVDGTGAHRCQRAWGPLG